MEENEHSFFLIYLFGILKHAVSKYDFIKYYFSYFEI